LAGDWRKATFTGAGFKLSNGAFSAQDTRAWTDITDLTIASQDAGSRGGETAFTATFTDGKLLFAATSSSTFHKFQTALTAHRIALQRSGLPPAQSRNWGCLFAVGCVVALPVTLIISSIINPSPPGPSALHAPQTTHVDRPTSQDDELLAMHIVQDAEQAVRDNLKDPDSAQV